MRPERTAKLVARWVQFYTRDLPAPVAQRRIEEIDADLHDHIAHERANGISDRRIALSIFSRMVRGLPADAAWRGRQAKLAPCPSSLEETMKASKSLYRSAVRVALGVALILSLPLVAMQFSDEVVWSLSDFVVVGVFLTVLGVGLELAVRKTGSLAVAVGIATVGVIAAVWGKGDDAPGLVLLGILLVVTAGALGVRTVRHSS
jgi:hypothetical protein